MSPHNNGPRHTAVVGLQWGDEGKGKVVDLLTARHDVIVRYNGGANAGHTVVVGNERYAVHLIPSGILYPEKLCVIGNGLVVDPQQLVEEIDALRTRGIHIGDNLRLSDRAHVVMPYHKTHDVALETLLASARAGGRPDLSIGTTRRGIGPAYADKVHRSTALRIGDLLSPDHLRSRLDVICAVRSGELHALDIDLPPLDAADLTEQYSAIGERLRPHITDTTYLLHDHLKAGSSMLFEGANASLLDIDHGTFPFVTSSNCSAAGIPAGTGLPGSCITDVLGIMKAYSTRVGAGAFPTEQDNEIGDRIRQRGNEYGTTTKRPRRCGWLDLVAVRYSAMISGVSGVAIMLLDVLSSFDELKICTHYRMPDGSVSDRFIPDARRLAEVEPVYETLPGWTEELDGSGDRAGLPDNAQRYLDRIEEILGVQVQIVSIGPERSQTLVCV